MNSELKNVLGEIDALAEEWDDGGAFDCLDGASSGSDGVRASSRWRRSVQFLNRTNLWWVPLAASIVVLLVAWMQAVRAGTLNREAAAAAVELAERESQHAREVETWRAERRSFAQSSLRFVQEKIEEEQFVEAIYALKMLMESTGRIPETANVAVPELRHEIELTRQDLVDRLILFIGHDDRTIRVSPPHEE